MPDALPTEIALIAPIMFKFQVYLTSFHHYYNRLITLPHVAITSPVNYTPHGIDQCPVITSRSSFVHKIGTPHTQYSLTQPQLPRVQLRRLP
jgi:hypothetical protein